MANHSFGGGSNITGASGSFLVAISQISIQTVFTDPDVAKVRPLAGMREIPAHSGNQNGVQSFFAYRNRENECDRYPNVCRDFSSKP
jgi:hypothetical protein